MEIPIHAKIYGNPSHYKIAIGLLLPEILDKNSKDKWCTCQLIEKKKFTITIAVIL